MAEASPVEIVARGPVACGSALWRTGGVLRVTFVVKATFGMVHEGAARLVAPVPVVLRDRHRDKDPTKGLEAAVDVAPHLDSASVTLTGHAYAPAGRAVPALSVRLAVGRERPLLDKTLHVFGDRAATSPGSPAPFTRMPIVYERAYGGETVGENPVGIGAGASSRLPNIVDPGDATKPAGFGPIAGVWPVRRGLLTAAMQHAVRGTVIEIAPDFPWSYFESAPKDQRIPYLVGDEWIAIDGMHPSMPRVSTRLPSAHAEVRAHLLGPEGVSAPHSLELVADMLTIDADQQRCSVVWRGHAELPEGEAGLARLRVFGAIALPGFPISWPSVEEVAAMGAPVLAIEETTGLPLGQTVTSVIDHAPAASVPFVPASPRREDESTRVLSLQDMEAQKRPPTPFQALSRSGLPFVATAPPATISTEIVDDATSTLVGDDFDPSSRPKATPFEGTPSSRQPITLDSGELEDDDSHTQMISAQELERQAKARDAAPFPIAQPGERRPGPAIPLPGAPWSPPALGAPPPPPLPPRPPAMGAAERVSPAAPPQVLPAAGEDRPNPNKLFHAMPVADRSTVGGLTEAAPPIPPRTSEVARVVLDGPLKAALVPWQIRPPEDSLTIVVKGSFDLVADEAARWREESDFPIGDLHAEDDDQRSLVYASDLAVMKLRADVTAAGRAYAPGGSSQAMAVSFRFGTRGAGFERTLNVFGDRAWKRSVIALAPSDPAPFSAMPLVYERAFGGPGFDANPVGVGHKAAAGDDGVARLPNVELPGRLVTSPGDSPPPASFAPVPPVWKERWSKLGTYDKKWFKSRWPYFPEDFDPGFFQAAPAAQQVAFLRGDEAFEFVGMRPDRPLLKGRLPGVVARAFVQRTPAAGGGFVEVTLELDTAAFDLEAMTVQLVWRGAVPVSDEDAPEVQNVFASSDALDGPRTSLEEMRARYVARVIPKVAVEESPAAPPPANDADAALPPDAESAALEASLQSAERRVEASLADAGVPSDSQPEIATPDPTQIAESLRRAGASDEDVNTLLAAMSPTPEETEARAPDRSSVRAEVKRRHQTGESLSELDLSGADLSDLDLSGASFDRALLKEASFARSRLDGATFAGAQLGGADLGEASLAGAVLTNADLTGAKLGDANLAGAQIGGADFSEANGAGASFTRASGERPLFVGGHFERANFDEAELPGGDYSRATLDAATFRRAKLGDARFYDAVGDRVSFEQASLPNARVEGARFPRGTFKGIDAPGSVWEKALLDEANLDGANLAAAGFLRASCRKASFVGADLTEARMRRARLTGASFARANLMNAILERADLSIADFRGANLHGAGLWKAQLLETKLDRALLTQSSLARRPP